MRPFAGLRAAHRDALDVLAPKHGAAPAAPGVPPVMRDRAVPNTALAGGADRGDAVIGTERGVQHVLCSRTRLATKRLRRFETHRTVINDEHGQIVRAADEDNRIASRTLGGHGKAAARQR